MQERHPEVIESRLRAAGFRLIDGQWIDTMASDA